MKIKIKKMSVRRRRYNVKNRHLGGGTPRTTRTPSKTRTPSTEKRKTIRYTTRKTPKTLLMQQISMLQMAMLLEIQHHPLLRKTLF